MTDTIAPTPEQSALLAELPLDKPVVMINLLKFTQPDGPAHYERYAREVRPHLEAVGARSLYGGAAGGVVIGEGERPWWDAILVVQYPTPAAFVRMVSSEGYAAVHVHRAQRARAGRADRHQLVGARRVMAAPRSAGAAMLDLARLPQVAGVEIEHRWVQARGLRFHVALAGSAGAEPLVLLHGWPQHWYEWRKVLPALSERRRCVLPDLRGLGWSDAPRSGYRKELLAADVLAVMDALEVERFDLIAHDWGGWTGFLIALGHPERVRRYLALNIVPPWPPWHSRRPRLRTALGLWRLWYQLVLATPWVGETLLRRTRAVERVLRGDGPRAGTFSAVDLAAFSRVLAQPARAHASSMIYREFLLREAGAILAGRYRDVPLRVPTHLLFGMRDWALGGPLAPLTAARTEDLLTVEPVQDAGHFIAEERPELVIARARELLDA